MNSKRIHYLCFYCDKEYQEKMITFPSVFSKIEYVKDIMLKLGFKVNIVSSTFVKNRGVHKACSIDVSENEKHCYFNSFKTGNSFINKFNTLYVYIQIFFYLLRVPKDDIIFVYHSLYYNRPLNLLKRMFGRKFYLEIEDVFSELDEAIFHKKEEEWSFFEQADGYLVVNDIIADKLKNDKKKVLSYGKYETAPDYGVKKDGSKIKLIYAGVIEQVRNAAFIAVNAMEHLDDRYEMYICGFGKECDLHDLEAEIEKINTKLCRKAVAFLGKLSGAEYEKKLQECDIALSTHSYDDTNIESANHTFPSKVLVYMGNGLRVVAQRLEVLERSEIGNMIFYYDCPKAECVAEAIMRVDLNDGYDSRKKIAELDRKFSEDLKELLHDE